MITRQEILIHPFMFLWHLAENKINVFFLYRKLKAEKEDLIKSRNQLSSDLERLLNQREVIANL